MVQEGSAAKFEVKPSMRLDWEQWDKKQQRLCHSGQSDWAFS